MRSLKRIVMGWVAVVATSLAAALTVKKVVPAYGEEADDSFSLVATISGREFASTTDHLSEGRALAFMGGIELDLTGATLAAGAELDLQAFMGGIEVVLPRSWRIELEAKERMGEVVFDFEDFGHGGDDAPLLSVHAAATLGTVVLTPSRES